MLALRLVRLIESHADQLSKNLLHRLEHDPRCSDFHKLPTDEITLRSFDIYRHLGDWLLHKTEAELERTYAEIGVKRASQEVAFSHVLHAMYACKEQLWKFLQEENVVNSSVELFGEMELFRLVDQFFDKALYYISVGYEYAHVAQTAHGR